MENDMPFISIIIPCRNEEDFIGRCLDSIITQDYPKDKFEVLVIDGMSEDATRKIIKEYNERFPFVNLLDNCKRITSSALNKGIKAAKGDIVIIMGAHSIYEKTYISQCVNYLTNGDADNVGGVCKILPQNNSLIAKSIAYALSSSFGAGNAYYRTGTKREKYVDTVFGGCYRKELFDKIGFFDEDLLRTQDSEFNARLIKNGGRILLVPTIVSYYYARKSLSELWKMNLQYGYSKPLAAKKIGMIFTLRQLIPPLFVGSLIISLISSMFFKPSLWLFLFVSALYIIVNLAFSLAISFKKSTNCFFILPFVFATIHFGWGIGYLKGVWDFIIFKKDLKAKIQDMPLTR
ncbi:MAG: glycosyltransferase family 2 protein [Planctomycetota bacterium]|jgi:cellulose synthase/poly-beta-1,6-N-acetylglucosamine synthase-like glycosyltransferase